MTSSEIVFNQIKDKLISGRTYLVRLKQRYRDDDKWEYITSLLSDDGDEQWIWEWDFDEGEQIAELIWIYDLDSISTLIDHLHNGGIAFLGKRGIHYEQI